MKEEFRTAGRLSSSIKSIFKKILPPFLILILGQSLPRQLYSRDVDSQLPFRRISGLFRALLLDGFLIGILSKCRFHSSSSFLLPSYCDMFTLLAVISTASNGYAASLILLFPRHISNQITPPPQDSQYA